HPESVIQDVDIPIARAPEFLAFFLEEIGILPVWICPIGGYDTQERFPLYQVDPRALYVNFGFWDVVQDTVRREPGHYNRKIERSCKDCQDLQQRTDHAPARRAQGARYRSRPHSLGTRIGAHRTGKRRCGQSRALREKAHAVPRCPRQGVGGRCPRKAQASLTRMPSTPCCPAASGCISTAPARSSS